MVEQMGGRVTVDSVLGEGSNFKIELQTKATLSKNKREEEKG